MDRTQRLPLAKLLQRTATCNTLQHTETHCNIREHTANHGNTLQHAATQYFIQHCNRWIARKASLCQNGSALHCNTLQHTATHCTTLPHNTTHCNTLQHTATLPQMDRTQRLPLPELLRTVTKHGIRGLFCGFVPTLCRGVMGNVAGNFFFENIAGEFLLHTPSSNVYPPRYDGQRCG